MKKISWLAMALCLALTLSSFLYAHQICPRTAYVNLPQVYDQFLLKKNYERQLIDLNQSTQFMLDSLQSKIEVAIGQYEQQPSEQQQVQIETMQREYFHKQQTIDEDKEKLVEQYEGHIWRQLNQFIRDYSEKENYDYLLGSSGEGTIMGGKASFDLTEEIIVYVNRRFNGAAQ